MTHHWLQCHILCNWPHRERCMPLSELASFRSARPLHFMHRHCRRWPPSQNDGTLSMSRFASFLRYRVAPSLRAESIVIVRWPYSGAIQLATKHRAKCHMLSCHITFSRMLWFTVKQEQAVKHLKASFLVFALGMFTKFYFKSTPLDSDSLSVFIKILISLW